MTRPDAHWKGRQLMDADKPFTSGEVAELFNVHPKTISRWAKDGRLASFRTLGGHRRFRVEDVAALLKKYGLKINKENRSVD